MSAILAFYRGTGWSESGWRLDEIRGWGNEQLEDVHDYIQWLFPLPERSMANPYAPVLDAKTIAAFRGDVKLRGELRASLDQMLAFYGFAWRTGEVVEGEDFAERAENWLTTGNHNHLRLTRMLRSLRILGLESESQALWAALQKVYASDAAKRSVSQRTYNFWTRAAVEELKLPQAKV